jgi:hypothetical protein
MRTIQWIVIALATSALAATASAQDVTYDYDRGQTFSRLQTFSFKDEPQAENRTGETALYDDPFARQRTNAAIAAELRRRGMRQDDGHPDVYVTTRRTFKAEYVTYGSPGFGWSWGYWGYPYSTPYGFTGGPWYTEEIVKGTLIVDLTTPDGRPVWRGVGERTIHPMSKPEKRAERISREVTKIFKTFPEMGAMATTGRDVPKPR